MDVRKRFAGDREAAFDYVGIAKNLLAQLTQSMQLNRILSLSRSVVLENGVRITVSSTYGQNEISIEAPPGVAAQVNAEIKEEAEKRTKKQPVDGRLYDPVKLGSHVRIRLETRLDASVPKSAPTIALTPVMNDSVGGKLTGSVKDFMRISGSLDIVIQTRTPHPDKITRTGGMVVIGGKTEGGDAFVWDSEVGYYTLDTGSNFFTQRRGATVTAISPNGKVFAGTMEIFDNTKIATVNDLAQGTGKLSGTVGWRPIAVKWASRNDRPQFARYVTNGDYPWRSFTVADNGTVTGARTDGGFIWDGNNNSGFVKTATPSEPAYPPTFSSSDGTRLTASNDGTYTLNGARKTWRGNIGLARAAPSDAGPFCCTRTKETVDVQVIGNTFVTLEFVFSG